MVVAGRVGGFWWDFDKGGDGCLATGLPVFCLVSFPHDVEQQNVLRGRR